MTSSEKITRIRVKNFRCLEELIISFEHSPIIALVAGNDSGKSSVVKAIQNIMYNDERDDKNYIRTGTKGYEIDVEFESGTVIARVKSLASNMYYLYDKTGKELGRWGSGTGDAKLGAYGIPDVVKQIFNVKLDDATGELLNLRTCESLLLFSLTKTTDNYKMVHSCISSHRIEKAYEIGNNHIKDANRELDKATALRDDSREQAAKIVTLPDETIERLKQSKAQLESMSAVISDMETVVAEKHTVERKQAELDVFGGQVLRQLEANQFTDQEFSRLSDFETGVALLQQIRIKQTAIQADKLAELEKHEITTAEIDKLRLLEEASTLLTKVNDLLAKSVDVAKVDQVEGLLEEIQSLNQQIQDIQFCISVINTITASEKTCNIAEQLSDAGEEMTRLQEVVTACQELMQQQRKLDEQQKALADLTTELETTQARLLSSGGVKYDVELNALVKNCEHCNEEVAFSLENLQLLDT